MPKPALSEIAIFSGRKELIESIKAAVKSMNLKNVRVESSSNPQEYLGLIKDRLDLCVVLDLERSVVPVLKILREETKAENRHNRPSVIFAVEISDHVVEMATEYMVNQVHTGPISEGSVKMTMEDLFQEVESTKGIRESLGQVSIARDQDDWEDAMEILEELLEKEPENDRVKTEMAENFMHFEKWKDAYETLQPIIASGNKNPRLMNMMGRCLLKLGKVDEATQLMSKAHLLNPYNVDRLLELGHLFLHQGDNQKAKESFGEAGQLDPGNKEAGKGMAQSCLLDGEVNEGLRLLREVASKKELASVFNTAGILCVRRKQVKKAIGLYNAAIQALDGEERVRAKLYFNSGIAHFRNGDEKQALELFEKASSADSSLTKAKQNAKLLSDSKSSPSSERKTPIEFPVTEMDDLDEEDEFL